MDFKHYILYLIRKAHWLKMEKKNC